jgi:hypothetical protein
VLERPITSPQEDSRAKPDSDDRASRRAPLRWRRFGVQRLYVRIGTEMYMISADGHLMPAKKGQAPPDLRYFNQPSK